MVVNLEGKVVVPGLIDSHVHFISGGLQVKMQTFFDFLSSCTDLRVDYYMPFFYISRFRHEQYTINSFTLSPFPFSFNVFA